MNYSPNPRDVMKALFAFALGFTLVLRADPPSLQPSDVLSLKGGCFYLDGKPFVEISFNKFDLLWAIWQGANSADPSELQRAMARQDAALRDLHAMGFRTIRIFGSPWTASSKGGLQAIWNDETNRKRLLGAIDTTLDLCEKNQIQVDFSLGLGEFDTGADATHASPLYTSPDSAQRRVCNDYLDTLVQRYKGRKAIAMWEVSNELTNLANIGNHGGLAHPTLDEVATFFDETAARIKHDDPLRLVSTGGSILRPAAWHLWHHKDWKTDTLDQYKEAYAGYFRHSAIDVIDTHYYELQQGGQKLADDANGKPVLMMPGDYVNIARDLGKGAIIGEFGTLPSGWSTKPDNGPHSFQGYNDPIARNWVEKGLDVLIEGKVPITYWWAYQSDRAKDKKSNPITFSMETTPELVKLIADANHRLQLRMTSKAK